MCTAGYSWTMQTTWKNLNHATFTEVIYTIAYILYILYTIAVEFNLVYILNETRHCCRLYSQYLFRLTLFIPLIFQQESFLYAWIIFFSMSFSIDLFAMNSHNFCLKYLCWFSVFLINLLKNNLWTVSCIHLKYTNF